MENSTSVKVGLFTLISLVSLYVGYRFLSPLKHDSYLVKVTMTDTKGLNAKSGVQLHGVKIGEVDSVELVNNQPVVTVLIQKKIDIPYDSNFEIASGLLISNTHLEVHTGTGAPLAKDGI